MKKLLLVAAIAFAVSASAQEKGFDPKKIDAKKTREEAAAALKASKEKKGSSGFTAADDCGAFTKTETDKEGAPYQAAKEFIIVSNDGTSGFGITMSNFMLEGEKYVMIALIALEKGVCVEKGNTKIVVTFEDDTQATFLNFQADNCTGIVKTYLGKKVDNLTAWNDLKTKKIKALKVTAAEKTILKSFSESNQVQFQGTIKCL